MGYISLGVPCYGGNRLLENLLKNLKNQYCSNFEVIVIDDGSSSLESAYIRGHCVDYGAKYIKHETNRGVAASYNTIVENSKEGYICFLDNDLVVPNNFIDCLLYFLRNNKTGVVGFKSVKVTEDELYSLGDSEIVVDYGEEKAPEIATELAGYCYAFERRLWKDLNGFNNNFKYYISDSEFCIRLLKAGYPSYRMKYPVVYHVEHATLDGYKELRASEKLNDDLLVFRNMYNGKNPRDVEVDLLKNYELPTVKWITPTGLKESTCSSCINL